MVICRGLHLSVGRDAVEAGDALKPLHATSSLFADVHGQDYDFILLPLARSDAFEPQNEDHEFSDPAARSQLAKTQTRHLLNTFEQPLMQPTILPQLLEESLGRSHVGRCSCDLIFEDSIADTDVSDRQWQIPSTIVEDATSTDDQELLGTDGEHDDDEKFPMPLRWTAIASSSRLQQELAYAAHCDLNTVVLPPLRVISRRYEISSFIMKQRGKDISSTTPTGFLPPIGYADMLEEVKSYQEVGSGSTLQMWIPVPLVYIFNKDAVVPGHTVWISLLELTSHQRSLKAMIDIDEDMIRFLLSHPSGTSPDDVLDVWRGLNVAAIRIHPRLLNPRIEYTSIVLKLLEGFLEIGTHVVTSNKPPAYTLFVAQGKAHCHLGARRPKVTEAGLPQLSSSSILSDDRSMLNGENGSPISEDESGAMIDEGAMGLIETLKTRSTYEEIATTSDGSTAVAGVENFRLSSFKDIVIRICERMPPLTEEESGSLPFYDAPQTPLQPLAWDLENSSYSVFEQDEVKYVRYYKAIFAALQHRMRKKVADGTTLMIVGAGRGPLVQKALEAIETLQLRTVSSLSMSLPMSDSDPRPRVRVFCIEKNPNAVHYLRFRCQRERLWKDVELVHADMREWNPQNMLADIMISELLGSFGDNELSPECLDGAQRFLNPDGGISIPSYCYNSLEPVMYDSMHHKAQEFGLEIPWVVRPNRWCPLSNGPKNCFDFVTPNPSLPIGPVGFAIQDDGSRYDDAKLRLRKSNLQNSRRAVLEFEASRDGICHGFLGYFHATLFDDISISIDPRTFSVEEDIGRMFSWFPMFFACMRPLLLSKGNLIVLDVNRASSKNDHHVWYQWRAMVFDNAHSRRILVSSGLSNAQGHAYKVRTCL